MPLPCIPLSDPEADSEGGGEVGGMSVSATPNNDDNKVQVEVGGHTILLPGGTSVLGRWDNTLETATSASFSRSEPTETAISTAMEISTATRDYPCRRRLLGKHWRDTKRVAPFQCYQEWGNPLPVLPRIRPPLPRGTQQVTHNGMPRQTLTSTRAIGVT